MEETETTPKWNHWTTTRTGTNTDPKTLRRGRDVPPAEGVYFGVPGLRPQHLSSMVSCDDGGVVTHSLSYFDQKGNEHWACNEDSYAQDEFKKLWPTVVVYPKDWKFDPQDPVEGVNIAIIQDKES